MRKEVAYRVRTALLVGAIALSGCEPVNADNQTPLPSITKQIESPESAWNSLPAIERVDRLQMENFEIPGGLDKNAEIVKALSETIAQQFPVKMTPSEMQRRVIFLETASFEKSDLFNILEITNPPYDPTDRNALIDKSAVTQTAIQMKNNVAPGYGEMLIGKDAESVLMESIVTYALFSLNQNAQNLDFPQPLAIQSKNGIYILTGIRNLNLQLTDVANNLTFNLPGLGETMTDIIAGKLKTNTGIYVPNPNYSNSKEFINALNEKAGISTTELIAYYLGEKPMSEFIGKWAKIANPNKPSLDLVYNLLFLVASSADPANNPQEIWQNIQKEIASKTFN